MTTLIPGTRSGDDVGAERAGAVHTLWIRRPDSLNAVSADVLEDLADLVEEAASSDARVIVLRGEGRGFCSGADLGDPENLAQAAAPTIDGANRLVAAIRDSPVPVVAVVQGACAGVGLSIALAADLVLASSKAFFMLAFTKIGLMPDGGASALVAAAVGRAQALRMALLAERLTAAEALEHGMIAKVFDVESFDAQTQAVIDMLSSGPRVAYARTKGAINAATLGQLDDAFARERTGQLGLLAAADFTEGSAAFTQKRAPEFTDTL